MPQFRKKPVVIDAFKIGHDGWPDWAWDKISANEIMLFLDRVRSDTNGPATGHVVVKTLEGDMRGEAGDYLIRGVKGEIYPCKSDIFEATYEKV